MLRFLQCRFFSSMKIPIESIKRLREDTSAPLGQCKKALQQNDGDHSAALTWLKQKGLLSAEKRQNKQTREGVIGSMVSGCRSKIALVQVNCETDFVAKNQLFLNFVNNIMVRAIEAEYLLDYQNAQQDDNKNGIDAFLQDSIATQLFPQDSDINNMFEEYKIVMSRLQQNIRVRRVITLHSDTQKFGLYVHQTYQDYVGIQASIVGFQCQPEIDVQNQQQLETFGQFADNIATQVLGSPAQYLRQDQIPQDVLKAEKDRVMTEMSETLKKAPQKMHQKIIGGKLHTTFYENCLLPKMNYLLSNDGIAVEDYWKNIEKKLNKKIKITRSQTWECK